MRERETNLLSIFMISLRLGLTSFGGPIAHLAFFRQEYVERRRWLKEKEYADLVALAQFIPGPASSQVGMGIGLLRGGLLGAFISFLGFTLPSVVVLMVFALALQSYGLTDAGWIQGLKVVAVAIVAQALIGMGRNLAPDRNRATIAVLTIIVLLVWQTVFSQVVLIAAAGAAGYILYKGKANESTTPMPVPLSKKTGAGFLAVFTGLLVILPLLRPVVNTWWFDMWDSFYRAGALVFGGGHVVLPLLEREVVPAGLVTADEFLAGYGMAQAVPGPLFTFASYLGTAASGIPGGIMATAAIFLPAFLLIAGVLPFWNTARQNRSMQGALYGINACVVGILAAAFYDPIFTSAVQSSIEAALAVLLFGLLVFWKAKPWVVVLTGALLGQLLL
ncbi:chromate transporter [Sinobaca qinghaiensis]|uniref:Chromate transporter n=1 Tax=Sinobaca qinghaiensis TaxID=342944 RepID=A0A419V7J6_9BACL|nr:chromate efflux transporter [Sinobaca qinghaiensis]RKD76051.1 chromate transporter [Sinobaca qinghaiensis]